MTSPDLSVFFRPKSVAIIGASRDPSKLGYGVVRNLIDHHYNGEIFPINRQADEILGHRAYPSIEDISESIDLAVIVVPAKYVAAELEICGKQGIHAAIIVSGGFREVGEEGLAREAQIKQIAQQHNIAIIGPNCIGTIDTHTPLNTTFVTGHPRPGEIALLSQSGAVVAAVIDWARGSGVGFSRIVSLGNQAGVTESDIIETIASESHTKVLTIYIEGVSDGGAFLENAASVSRTIPIVALKVGRGSGGAKAIESHTGALAGAEAAYEAAFRRAGILRASTLEEMFDWARALAWQPLPQGNRVAVLTNAGGPGIMAVDALEAVGMKLAPLTEDTKSFLRQRVPPAASIENPVDILAGSGPAMYALCLDALLADKTVDAVVVMTAPQDWFAPVSLAEVVGEVSNSSLGRRKPVLAVIMGLASTSEATQILHRRHTPNFAFPERIASTLAAMWKRKQWLDSQSEVVLVQPSISHDDLAARDIIYRGLDAGTEWMTSDLVEKLLRAYQIPMPRSELATTADDAEKITTKIGYPVALKLAASGITHKTDIGGVILNIKTPDELKQSFEILNERFEQRKSESSVMEGVTIQQMIQDGIEAIVGVVRDPQFGPLLMVGSGGTLVELVRDTTFELCPLNQHQANEMIDRTQLKQLLAGFRGRAAGDRDALVNIMLKLAQLAMDCPEIAEMEINPVMVQFEGAFAVDVRIRLESVE